jgi:hypothetical protein
MCPDRELLSAWVDGEVSSPWRESLERHLEACPSCSAYTAELVPALCLCGGCCIHRQPLQAVPGPGCMMESSWVFLHGFRCGPVDCPSRYLWLPPLLCVFCPGLALAMTGARNSELRMAVQSAVAPVPVASSGPAMDSIFEFLARQEGGVNITISLPSGTFAGAPGEPFIVREVDYKPGSGQ